MEEHCIIKKNRQRRGRSAFSYFSINDEDIDLGLRHIKAKVRIEFRRLAKRYHPDTRQDKTSDTEFKHLCRLRESILTRQVMPITIDNMEAVLDIEKGYKSSNEVELPLEIREQ